MVKTVATPVAQNGRRGFINNRRPLGGVQKFRTAEPKPMSSVFNRKWLEENDKDKKPFSEELLSTTFGKENLEKLVAAVKLATETEVNESNRLLADDYVYSVQITSHRAPHIPVHLSRM